MWTEEDRESLQLFTEAIDFDNIKVKETIKKVLLDNRFIIHVLNNKELQEQDAEPDLYYGVNILPYYLINPTQYDVQNFICYETNVDKHSGVDRNNYCVKRLEIIFYILCEQKTVNDEDTGISRHDLLSALIQDQFNYTNYFGRKIELTSDISSVVDSKYACRTLIFQQITDNNLVKSNQSIINGDKVNIPRLANKDVIVLEES